jgi:hypothetical protein
MASEWVGVVGTGIGAAIGGVVTVVSLWVKGGQDRDARREEAEREDRLRADDRAWTVTLQNVEQRREFHAELIERARALVRAGRRFVWSLQAPDVPEVEVLRETRADELLACLIDYRSSAARAEVMAIDHDLLDTARRMALVAANIVALAPADGGEPAIDLLRQEARDLRRLSNKLTVVCRRDLGLPNSQEDDNYADGVIDPEGDNEPV